jgi:transcriptional/translational regulatory protein YebC/TACO1
MLPNQTSKMTSSSIVREMPKVEIEIESEEDIEDVKGILDVLEDNLDS